MKIRTPADLGALIRNRRTKLHLDQSALARKVGVSRLWVIEVEKGKPRAEMGLVLRTLEALHINLTATTIERASLKPSETSIDINDIVSSARKPRL
jgi:y4mF family transcriptional regulator